MSKIFWFDTETTGINAQLNSIIQLAAIVEINGSIKEKIELLFRPRNGTEIDPEALKVNGRSKEEILEFPPARVSLASLKKKLAKHVNKFNTKDKFVPAGYNVMFDINFLRQTFWATGDKYFGSFFYNCPLDVWSSVAGKIIESGLWLPNFKLTTACKAFGITMDNAHDAMCDIEATRNLYYRIKSTSSRPECK